MSTALISPSAQELEFKQYLIIKLGAKRASPATLINKGYRHEQKNNNNKTKKPTKQTKTNKQTTTITKTQ